MIPAHFCIVVRYPPIHWSVFSRHRVTPCLYTILFDHSIANYACHKLFTCTLAYSHPLNEALSTPWPFAHSENPCLPCLPCLPCSVGIRLQPPTTQLTLNACQHAHQHMYQNAIHTQHYPLHCLPPPFYANTSSWRWGRGCLLKYSVCLVHMPPSFVPRSLEYVWIWQSRWLLRLSEITTALLNVYYEKSVVLALILSQEAPKQLASSVVMGDNST